MLRMNILFFHFQNQKLRRVLRISIFVNQNVRTFEENKTSSAITLKSTDTGRKILYIYHYWSDSVGMKYVTEIHVKCSVDFT